MSSDTEEQQVSAKTYIPSYQLTAWESDANAREMSTSEFIRTMVQAGRKGFGDTPSAGPHPGGSGLERTLQDLLADEPMTLDELLAELERKTEQTLEQCKENGRIEQHLDGRIEWRAE